MKTQFILALFFSLLLFIIILPNKEGFDPRCHITNASSRIGKANNCQYATIYNTTKNSESVTKKLTELSTLVDRAINKNKKNTKGIDTLIRNGKAMSNAVSSDAEDDEDPDPDPCDKYDEAC